MCSTTFEGWTVDWGRERGRDPGMYYLRVFGEPGGTEPWGWRFGGHHVSLNNLVVDGTVVATTPCFFGADPAAAPLLGPAPLRPLAGPEDLARDLVRSLDPERAARAILLDRAPADIVGGNRTHLSDGDQMIHLRDIWRGYFTEPRLDDRVTQMGDGAERASGYDAGDHQRIALTSAPKGLPARELDTGQRNLLRALLATYTGRVPDGLPPQADYADDAALDAVHLAWAGLPAGPAALLPAAGPAAAHRVRQHPAPGEPRPRGVARSGGGLRLRRPRRPPGRAPSRQGRYLNGVQEHRVSPPMCGMRLPSPALRSAPCGFGEDTRVPTAGNVTRRCGKQPRNKASPGTVQLGWTFRRAVPACIVW